MSNNPQNLLNFLLTEKAINQQQFEEINTIKQSSKKSTEDILLEQKIIEEEKLTEFKANLLNLPYVNLTDKKIGKDILEIIAYEVADNYKVICFAKKDKKLSIGIVDPNNLKAREAISFFAKGGGYEIEYYIISSKSFKKSLEQYKSLREEIEVALKAREEEKEIEKKGKVDKETEEIIRAAPVSKIVSVIIRHAVEGGASDIHIEPIKDKSRIRYRIDGVLYTSLLLPRSVHDAVVARIKVLASLKLDERRVPQDGRIRLNIEGKQVDFRVSTLPLVDAEKVAMRILDVSRGAPKLTDLGFEGRNLEVIINNTKKTDGIMLVTGPTGSGKSTTLFSILNILNKEGVNISTLEDPVEYFVEGVNQSQIRSEIGFKFASGLRALLRQDPNIIMVGEIRDSETAELAIHSALTGHLVLSTLHTNDAISTIARLIDMKVEPFLLSSTLNAIVAQRLLRKICPNCKTEEEINDEIKKTIISEIKIIYDLVDDETKQLLDKSILNNPQEKKKLYKGKGCARCGSTGYSGRLAIAEVLDVNNEIRSLIVNKKEIEYNSDILKKQNFISIKQNGIIRALQGMTSMEEVLRVMSD